MWRREQAKMGPQQGCHSITDLDRMQNFYLYEISCNGQSLLFADMKVSALTADIYSDVHPLKTLKGPESTVYSIFNFALFAIIARWCVPHLPTSESGYTPLNPHLWDQTITSTQDGDFHPLPSTFHLLPSPQANPSAGGGTTTRRTRFLNVFPSIVQELVEVLESENMPEDVVKWFQAVCTWKSGALL
jgi:hypothetical protein